MTWVAGPQRSRRSTNAFAPAALAAVLLALVAVVVPPAPAAAQASDTVVRVTVGERLIYAPEDRRGGAVSYTGLPEGARVLRGPLGFVIWSPDEDDIGEQQFVVTIRRGGAPIRSTVTVQVRARAHDGLLLAMGDSIASGHGLDRSDFFGFDPCWRDADAAYARRAVGRLGGDDDNYHLVACSGFRTADLFTQDVSGGPRDVGRSMTQIEWALRSNPAVITLTIGANDLRFDRPQEFFDDGRFLADVAAARVDTLEQDLGRAVRTLVEGTDSVIVLTSVHNPTADKPHGVSGCREACFAEVTAGVVDDVNAAIDRVVAAHRGRVLLADVAPSFVGHGSANGRGPDWLRAGGGFVSRRLPIPTRGVHPFCQVGHGDVDTWISTADCVHPNGEGADAYAAAVVSALRNEGHGSILEPDEHSTRQGA